MNTITRELNGFTITFVQVEGSLMLPDLLEPSDVDGIQARLDSGELELFDVECYASKHGVQFPSNWMGGCIYASLDEFVQSGGYADDMTETAVEEARNTLALFANDAAMESF